MATPNQGYDSVALDFFAQIGRIIIGWSEIERALDVAARGGKQFAPKFFKDGRAPISLSKKIKTVRAIGRQFPEIFKDPGYIDRQLDGLLKLSVERNVIVHGFFHGVSDEPEPRIYFRLAPPLTGETGERLIKTREELESYIERLRSAKDHTTLLMLALTMRYRSRRGAAQSPTLRG